MWPLGSQQHWPQCWCPEPPNLSHLDDTDQEVDTKLLSISNPWCGEGDGDGVMAAQGSHFLWLQSQLHCYAQPHSWIQCPMVTAGHLQSFSSSWVPHFLWGLILIAEAKWLWCRWNWVRMSGSSGFNASFSDSLGNQLPAFLQAYCIGIELGFLTNPTDGSW